MYLLFFNISSNNILQILLYNSFQKHNSFTSLSKNPYINIENVNLLSIDNEINEINEIDDDEN